MNNEQLFRAIGEVGDDLVARAEYPKKQKTPWGGIIALAACAALVISFYGARDMIVSTIKGNVNYFIGSVDSSFEGAPIDRLPATEDNTEEQDAVVEESTAEEPAAAQPAVVFVSNTYLRVENDMQAEPLELVGFVEEGYPDYIGCEIYSCADEDCIFVLHEGEYELFRLE